MQQYITSLPAEDRLPLELSRLYEQYGYQKYCMSKFEEYGFYSDNRDFLSTGGIITFHNSAGKLMALKPDITLSIVKNARTLPNGNARYYYNENVYRITEDTHDCKEIKQCGIELLGEIDTYATAEMVHLALESLKRIDPNFTLILSHNGFVSAVLEDAGIYGENRRKVLGFLKRKNKHDLARWCEQTNVRQATRERLLTIADVCGSLKSALAELEDLVFDDKTNAALKELTDLNSTLCNTPLADHIKLDLSVLNHLDYYNGILLQGYVQGAAAPVLSGGRYDSLAHKIRGEGSAFGFAVYLDGLNLYYPNRTEFDCDLLILYEQSDSALLKIVNEQTAAGLKVRVERTRPSGLTARKTAIYKSGKLMEVAE